jgi:hypothetical protein
MKLKKTTGYRLHNPLSYAFTMLEIGGSYVQKYNVVEKEYNPDREVTPFLLKPCLIVTDPDGAIPDGDYTTKLVSVKWKVDKYINHILQEPLTYTEDKSNHLLDYGDYTVDTENNSLTYKANTAVGELIVIKFAADFVDNRRTPPQVQHFEWDKTLSCISEDPQSIDVRIDMPSKLNLSPFKERGQFAVTANVKNGGKDINTFCNFSWEFFDSNKKKWISVKEELESLPWYVGGCDVEEIIIDQDYIGKLLLRCSVTLKNESGTYYSPVSLIRRWYGQYEEKLDIIQGKYIYDDTALAKSEVVIENRQGNINNPSRYFDISIFYPNNNGVMTCISNMTIATLTRTEFNEDNHEFGLAVRELSQFVPIEDENGAVLCDENGIVLFAQFPMVEIETEE